MTRKTIPEIRDRYHRLADGLRVTGATLYAMAAECDALADETKREYRSPVAPRRARRSTPEMGEALRRAKLASPETPNREIGQRFGVDGGRVSEAFGKRGEE